MEELLQRLLKVEAQAQEQIQTAEAESDHLAQQARREAADVQQELEQQLAAELEGIVQSEVAGAEQRKREALAASVTELAARETELRLGMPEAVACVVRRLAFGDGDDGWGRSA